MFSKKNLFLSMTALAAGFINGLLGTGGGMVVLSSLIGSGMNRQKAHVNSVCIIFFICLSSAFIYLNSHDLDLTQALPYIPWGILGSITGSMLLPKTNQSVLRKLFGCFSIWAAYRLITK